MTRLRIYLKNFYNKIDHEKKLYQFLSCCSKIKNFLQKETPLLIYNAKFREYGFLVRKTIGYLLMHYCIYCGKKTPDSLRKIWIKKMKTLYHLSLDQLEKDSNIPKDFLSEKWWQILNIPDHLPSKKRVRYMYIFEFFHRTLSPRYCVCIEKKLLNKDCNNFIVYNTRFREYGVKAVRKRGPYTPMTYCLWCGRQLEPSLRDLWAKLLQKEHGIANPFATPIAKLPKSFRTDEWWKRRGL